jgi:hypothetical protein
MRSYVCTGEAMAATLCQVGRIFARCTNVPEHSCQYCGRSFCAEHTHFVGGHEAVCARKACRLKYDDLDAHLRYRERVEQRNKAGLCGIEDCGPHPGFECSLCRGHFCGEHLRERMYPFSDGYTTVERPVSICARCWERRKVWRPR